MEARELRIGNLVLQTQNWGEKIDPKVVTWNEGHWYDIGDCILYMEDFEPIRLNEEWLVKFGFDVSWMSGMVLIQLKINDSLNLVRPYSENCLGDLEFSLRYGSTHLNTVKIKYVNQLQNLYFALTGEELEIK